MGKDEKKPSKKNLLEKDLLIAPVGTGKPFPITDELIKKMSLSEKENLVKFFNLIRKKGGEISNQNN